MTKLRSSLYSQALQRRSRPRDNHPSHGFPCTQCPSLSGPILIIDIEQFSASRLVVHNILQFDETSTPDGCGCEMYKGGEEGTL